MPGAEPRGVPEYGFDRPEWNSARSDYGSRAYRGHIDERGMQGDRDRQDDRGWWDRASDEVASWFGNEEAERRRRRDEERYGSEDRDQGWGWKGSMLGENWTEEHPGQAYRGNRGSNARYRNRKVSDVMTSDVVAVYPNHSIPFAARLMRDEDCGGLPVVDRQGRPLGMITDRDITCRLVASANDVRRAQVSNAMTHDVFTCSADSSIDDCMNTMSRHQVRRLLVIDDRDRLVGIVSQSDLALEAERRQGSGARRAVADVVGAVSEPTDRPYR